MAKEELQAKRAVALRELKDIEVTLCLDEHYIDIIEKENAELKNKLTEKVTLESLDVVSARMNDLEKENAQLKARLNAINLLTPELEKLSKAKTQQLTKATELLNEFMRIGKASDEDFEHDYSELIRETEQFIKEI